MAEIAPLKIRFFPYRPRRDGLRRLEAVAEAAKRMQRWAEEKCPSSGQRMMLRHPDGGRLGAAAKPDLIVSPASRSVCRVARVPRRRS